MTSLYSLGARGAPARRPASHANSSKNATSPILRFAGEGTRTPNKNRPWNIRATCPNDILTNTSLAG